MYKEAEKVTENIAVIEVRTAKLLEILKGIIALTIVPSFFFFICHA